VPEVREKAVLCEIQSSVRDYMPEHSVRICRSNGRKNQVRSYPALELAVLLGEKTDEEESKVRPIDADTLIEGRVCNDPVRIAAMCAKTIEPDSNWIPCTYGMMKPKNEQVVNITYECRGEKKTCPAKYAAFSDNFYGCDRYGSMILGVLAWQPLPDPYNNDHIRDTTKKVDQLRDPTKMMEGATDEE
jgi:hypothetical protein